MPLLLGAAALRGGCTPHSYTPLTCGGRRMALGVCTSCHGLKPLKSLRHITTAEEHKAHSSGRGGCQSMMQQAPQATCRVLHGGPPCVLKQASKHRSSCIGRQVGTRKDAERSTQGPLLVIMCNTLAQPAGPPCCCRWAPQDQRRRLVRVAVHRGDGCRANRQQAGCCARPRRHGRAAGARAAGVHRKVVSDHHHSA